MVRDIHDGMDTQLPDRPNRPEVYYYNRCVLERHLTVPEEYSIDVVHASNAMRSEGWEAANVKEE